MSSAVLLASAPIQLTFSVWANLAACGAFGHCVCRIACFPERVPARSVVAGVGAYHAGKLAFAEILAWTPTMTYPTPECSDALTARGFPRSLPGKVPRSGRRLAIAGSCRWISSPGGGTPPRVNRYKKTAIEMFWTQGKKYNSFSPTSTGFATA